MENNNTNEKEMIRNVKVEFEEKSGEIKLSSIIRNLINIGF
jgi:hypothetical protein